MRRDDIRALALDLAVVEIKVNHALRQQPGLRARRFVVGPDGAGIRSPRTRSVATGGGRGRRRWRRRLDVVVLTGSQPQRQDQ